MHNILAPAWALALKDWRRFIRQPFLMVISVVMPLVFIFFYSIIVPSSSTSPIVIAMEDHSAAAQRLVEILHSIRSDEGVRYYEVVTLDPQIARARFAERKALGMIVIPAGFGSEAMAVASQDSQIGPGPAASATDRSAADRPHATVQLHLNNINSDYSKNLRLRLDYAVRIFNTEVAGPVMTVHETRWLAKDPPMQSYINTSLLLFACLYAGMVNTGLHVAGEWNDRTIKTLLLAPVGRGALILGKMIAGLGQSLVSLVLVLAVLVLGFRFDPVGSRLARSGIMALVLVLGAAIGAVVGVASKKTLAVTSSLIALAVAIFLISGNADSLRGLAWAGPIVGLWHLSQMMPTTYAFLAARSIFLTGDTANLGRDLAVVAGTAVVVMAFAAALLRRAYSQLSGGQ